MIRKAIYATAVLGLLGTVVFGRDVFSYARTWGTSVRESVKSEVPLEFEVKRAREMVESLVPEIRECMHVIAEQEVDVEHLEREIARRSQNLDEQKEVILSLREDLRQDEGTYQYAGHTYTTQEVKRDLATRFERFKIAEETLERENQVLRAREKALEANRDKLQNMLVAKQDLAVQIEQLEARLKAVEAAETVATLDIDQSQLARTKKLIRDLNKQLDVKEKMLDAEGKFTGLIPVESDEQEVSAEIGSEVDAYFGSPQDEKKAADKDGLADWEL